MLESLRRTQRHLKTTNVFCNRRVRGFSPRFSHRGSLGCSPLSSLLFALKSSTQLIDDNLFSPPPLRASRTSYQPCRRAAQEHGCNPCPAPYTPALFLSEQTGRDAFRVPVCSEPGHPASRGNVTHRWSPEHSHQWEQEEKQNQNPTSRNRFFAVLRNPFLLPVPVLQSG